MILVLREISEISFFLFFLLAQSLAPLHGTKQDMAIMAPLHGTDSTVPTVHDYIRSHIR